MRDTKERNTAGNAHRRRFATMMRLPIIFKAKQAAEKQ